MSTATPIYLCGPTASGKSSLAISLAQSLGGEIVNADAFQLYRGLETLTAAPSTEEQSTVPHHLYGVLDPDETCDAMRYRELALPVIEEISSRGVTPIVTGGSGLYLKFLTHGPSPLPTGDHKFRETLAALSLEELAAKLEKLDPVEASRTAEINGTLPTAGRSFASVARGATGATVCTAAGAPGLATVAGFTATVAGANGAIWPWARHT